MKVKRTDFSNEIFGVILFLAMGLYYTWDILEQNCITNLKLDEFLFLSSAPVIMYYMAFSMWIAHFREIKMDVEGVTVRFGKYKKKYCWEELKEKQLAKTKWYEYEEVVILSRRKTHRRMKWIIDPIAYNVMCRPFSYMVIHLEDEKSGSRCAIYKIDKKEFLENLEKWNVKLEDGGCVRFFSKV